MDDIKPAKKIIDVAAPGKSAPSPTSKPAIVTNRPIVKDPMMTDAGDADSTASAPEAPADVSPESPASVHKALALTPGDDAVAAAAEQKAGGEPASTTSAPAEPADASSDSPESSPAPEIKPADVPADKKETQKAADTASADQPDQPTPNQEADAEAKKQAEHDAALQKLVDGKQYFLPINMVEKRRTKQFVALGLVLAVLLALVWVDIALDAGLIHLGGIKPLTHFFST